MTKHKLGNAADASPAFSEKVGEALFRNVEVGVKTIAVVFGFLVKEKTPAGSQKETVSAFDHRSTGYKISTIPFMVGVLTWLCSCGNLLDLRLVLDMLRPYAIQPPGAVTVERVGVEFLDSLPNARKAYTEFLVSAPRPDEVRVPCP